MNKNFGKCGLICVNWSCLIANTEFNNDNFGVSLTEK